MRNRNNDTLHRKRVQTNAISKPYQGAAMGFAVSSVVLTKGVIKVFCRSPAQTAACRSHCRRGSEAQGYLWITHWFPCD